MVNDILLKSQTYLFIMASIYSDPVYIAILLCGLFTFFQHMQWKFCKWLVCILESLDRDSYQKILHRTMSHDPKKNVLILFMIYR